MLHSILSRPSVAKLTMALILGAQMLGWITLARGNEPLPPAPPPLPKSRSAERRALREFDRFLDHHPLLEDQLRLAPQLVTTPSFLKKSTDLRDFLSANPNAIEALKTYPRYFLNRALLRQANAPVSFKELAAFKDLFLEEPQVERDLTVNPELIHDAAYVQSHPSLRECLLQHPVLAQVFLPPALPSESK